MEAYEYLRTLIANKTGHSDSITQETSLKDLGIDSLDLVELILQVEEKFDLVFEDDELLALKTMGEVSDLIRSKKQ
ncbi:MAG: acyl carrier protein [Erysipelotrichaceae bacterium]